MKQRYSNIGVAALMILSAIAITAGAAKMDMHTHDEVISRLEKGLDGMDKKESARPGILLRLADLYADRARLKAMDEVEKKCDDCNGAKNDRILAIDTYREALPVMNKADQGSVVLQIAHLQNLNGQTSASQALYRQIVNAKRGTYSSQVMAMAYSALGEIEFRKGEFKKAYGFYNLAKKEDLKAKGFIQYRIAWCQLNMKQEKQATQTLINILSSPALLATQTTDGKTVDPTFADDVSSDLALFLARGKVGVREINLLKQLSSDKMRAENLKTLAEETDRLGKKEASLVAWAAYVDEGNVSHMDKLEVQVRVAKIFYDMNKQDLAAAAYVNAMGLWKQGGCTEPTACEELKTRLRKFVTAWNKAQKEEPSVNVLNCYIAYISVFNDDAEMYHWAGIVASQTNKFSQAADLFHGASLLAHERLKKEPDNKVMKNIFEGSLLAEIEMAESSKDFTRREKAYNFYLQMNPGGDMAFDVRYQRANLYYEAKNTTQAYSEFNWLARQPGTKKNADMRVKSADLALDILVSMKNDQELRDRAIEFSGMYPQRKAEYLRFARTASFNMVERKSANEAEAALAILAATNMQGASTQEQVKYYKNKIALAQKARKLDVVDDAADGLLSVKGVIADDREYAYEQKVWVNELKLKFGDSYRLTQKMALPRLTPANRELRLAMLAELSGNNPKKHYERYLRMSRDRRANNLVRVTLVKNSNYSWRELDKHLNHLKSSPDLLAPLALEAFANNKNYIKAQKLLKTTRIANYPAGAMLSRQVSIQEFRQFDRKIRSHQIFAYNDTILRKTLRQRMNLITQSEKNAKQALRKRDWTLQMMTLTQLARENRRVYNDISRLPIPRKLNKEDRAKYQILLAQQSQPYLDRAVKIERETQNMWTNTETLRNFETVYNNASPDLRKLYRDEMAPLAITAPPSAKNRLDTLLNTPYQRPSRHDVMVARQDLQADPFNEGKTQRLRDLENESGGHSMVSYLDARLNEMKKRNL